LSQSRGQEKCSALLTQELEKEIVRTEQQEHKVEFELTENYVNIDVLNE
jgi:hypothetical protein